MASPFVIRVEGLEALDRRLRELPPKIERKVLRTALRGTANKVATRLRAGTPRRSGLSAGAIKVTARVGNKIGAYAAVKYSAKRLAGTRFGARGRMRMREYGNPRPGRTQPPRPFFRAAVSGWEGQVTRDLHDALRDAVEKVGG